MTIRSKLRSKIKCSTPFAISRATAISRQVWQSMMEVRMHPRSEGNQRCFVFQLSVNPRARIFGYTDSYGNLVHHFDLPRAMTSSRSSPDALVNIEGKPPVPESMAYESWTDLEDLIEKNDYWDMLMPINSRDPLQNLKPWPWRWASTKERAAVRWRSFRTFAPA